MISWQVTAGLALAAALATGALFLERAQHEATRQKVAAMHQALATAIGANERLTAERNAYKAAQAALSAALVDAEAKAKAEAARVRHVASAAAQADQKRRARPDLPPPEEMTDALRDAARPL